jgi:hypothetical protein
MMEAVILLVLAALVVAVIVWGLKQIGGSGPSPTSPEPWQDTAAAGERLVLDLSVDDPQHPSVQRLVHAAARQALASSPDVDTVEVLDRNGMHLGTVERDAPLPRELEVPATLHEPHAKRSRGPRAVPQEGGGAPQMEHEQGPVGVAPRTWVDRFDLSPAIRAAVRDPERPADVIRAILAAGGLEPELHGNLVRLDDTAIVVVSDVRDGASEAINRAYLQYKETDARHAIIVRLGYVDPDVIRRHDAATPDVRHISAEGVQRMADAVTLEADPLAFALGPAVLRRP